MAIPKKAKWKKRTIVDQSQNKHFQGAKSSDKQKNRLANTAVGVLCPERKKEEPQK